MPVLLKEAVSALLEGPAPAPRVWLDGTFGRGGHSRALLDQLPQEDRLIVIDRDPVFSRIRTGLRSVTSSNSKKFSGPF